MAKGGGIASASPLFLTRIAREMLQISICHSAESCDIS